MAICIKHKLELVADICEDCIIEASEKTLSNFGISDYVICGL